MYPKSALRWVEAILTMLSTLPVFACTQEPYGARGNWPHMMGYGFNGGSMWLIVVVIIAIAIYFVLQASKSKGSSGPMVETPLDILKKRFAKGEIDEEEFERKKKNLEP